jgi:hypothetical protein
MIDKDKDNIQVMVRVRPLNEREKNEGAVSCVNLNPDNPVQILLDCKNEIKSFNFDCIANNTT